jgi:hypothetical protein
MPCLGLDSGIITCKVLILAPGMKCVDLTIRAERLRITNGGATGATRKNEPLYMELVGRQADFARKLVNGGYL